MIQVRRTAAAITLALLPVAARPQPAPAADAARPSAGTIVCLACAGVLLGERSIRYASDRPAPACGVVMEPVELRAGAGALASGTAVAFTRAEGGMVRVRTAASEAGLAPAASVKPGASAGCEPLPAEPVALRRTANVAADVVAELAPGARVTFGPTAAQGWLFVKGPAGQEGFVPAAAVRADGEAAPVGTRSRRVLELRLGAVAPFAGPLDGWGRPTTAELGLGVAAGRHLRLEASVAWRARLSGTNAEFGDGRPRVLRGSLRVLPLMARARLLAAAGEAEVSAAVGVGVGLASWEATRAATAPALPVSRTGSPNAFLAEAGLGVSVPVGARTRLGVELRATLGDVRVDGTNLPLDALGLLLGLSTDL
ncbi:MAG: hypothetical protein QM704_07060 [Anaeromyxobacteraceae bacterium]